MVRDCPKQTRRTFLGALGASLPALVGGGLGATGRPDAAPPRATPTPWRSDPEFDPETVATARETGLRVRDSTVYIVDDDGKLSGTGWFAVESDVVVTAGHVALGKSELGGWLPDGTRLSLEVLGRSFTTTVDVAVARADTEAPPLELGTAEDLSSGQPLVCVGHSPVAGNWAITLGRFRSMAPSSRDLATTVPTGGGFSGGPTVTMDGTVVGHVGGPKRFPLPPGGVIGPDDTISGTTHERAEVVETHLEEWTDG